MKRIAAMIASFAVSGYVLAACSACKKSPPLFERVYGLTEIPVFEIVLEPAAVTALRDKPREWVQASFRYRDTTLTVGVHLKGHRSFRKLTDKPSFKIKFDKFDKDTKLAGQSEITLNNMVEDPTLMREVLAYRLYDALGVAAPKAGFAELKVNGESKGLYAVIESINKKFFKQRFDDPSGPVYEGVWGCDVVPEDVAGFDQDGGTSEDRSALAHFAQVATGDAKLLFGPTSPLDVPAFLRFLAVEMYVGNFDGYRHGHNYRIYYEPTKQRWYFIPWGLDRTFVKNMSIFDSQGYLAKRCFADEACRTEYVRTMREVVAQARKVRLEDGETVIAAITKEAVIRDSRRASDVRARRQGLRDYLLERPVEVERELTCIDGAGTPLDADHDGFACRDCNDRDPAIHPGAPEQCDNVDSDCDGIVDNAPCACQPVNAGDSHFLVCPFGLPYREAAAMCVAAGGTLAHIDSADEDRAIREAAKKARSGPGRPDRFWLGLDDREVEGTFKWLAGTSTYSHWDRGEPDNSGCNQDCVAVDADNGRWVDTHCLEHHPFFCRLP